MLILSVSFFFMYTVYAVVNPFLQVMLRNIGYSYDAVGVLLSLFEVSGIIGPLVIAKYTDKHGNMKAILMFSTVASMAGMVILMFSSTWWMTSIGLVVLAFFIRSLTPVLDTYTNNMFNGDSRRYSLIRSLGSIGFVVFSLLFAATNRPDLKNNLSIGLTALVLNAIFLVLLLMWKREPRQDRKTVLVVEEEKGPWHDKAFFIGLVIIALNRFSMSSISSFFSLYLVEYVKVNAISFMNAIGAASEVGAMILAGMLIQKKKVLPVHLLMMSGVAMVVRMIIYATIPTYGGVLVAQMLHSICYGFFHPAAIYFIARRVRRSHRTLGMSMYISFGTGLPAVLGSMLGGVIVERFGYPTLFLSYGIFAMISVLLCLVYYRRMTSLPIEQV